MTYENPQVPHEVNVSKNSLLMTFIRLSAALMLLLVIGFAMIYFGLRFGAQYIPYSVEKDLGALVVNIVAEKPKSHAHTMAQKRLQGLAENLAKHMNAPAEMPVHIHLSDDPLPNAFATFGGNIVLTQGLLDNIHSENALAMVIAHELAHVKNRDPLVSVGTGIVFSLVLSSITGGGIDANWLTNTTGNLTQLSFSREQERAADADALKALESYYGHTLGAEQFFEYMMTLKQENVPKFTEFLQTHPDTRKRIALIKENQKDKARQTLTPLADEILSVQGKRR